MILIVISSIQSQLSSTKTPLHSAVRPSNINLGVRLSISERLLLLTYPLCATYLHLHFDIPKSFNLY